MGRATSDLEKIRFSITRLKFAQAPVAERTSKATWKDKILDYEIEILTIRSAVSWPVLTWKDKILDYEIEIGGNPDALYRFLNLEKIRFSITRLK